MRIKQERSCNMKNKSKLFGLAVLVTAIVFSFAACKNESTNPTLTPTTDPALNGTWVQNDGSGWGFKFNNGTWEHFTPNPYIKGTFTTSDRSMTIIPTLFWGNAAGLSLGAKWCTKAELISAGQEESEMNTIFAPKTYTYAISGNTLTLTLEGRSPDTYTKQP